MNARAVAQADDSRGSGPRRHGSLRPLRVLVVEDSENDLLLLLAELKRSGWDVSYECVETADAMQAALARTDWDAVLSDYSMPTFSALGALKVFHETGLDLPFIVTSGTIDEDAAVEALRAGAHDFIVKGRFARLGPAIDRELREASIRRQLRASREALDRTEKLRALGQMAAGVSHDLKNLLNPISLHLQTMQRALGNENLETMTASIGQMQEVVRRGVEMLERLRAFSRQEPDAPAQTVDLNHLAREAIAIVKPRLSSRSAALSSVVEELGKPPAILARPDEVIAVVVNLVGNAIDAMDGGGVITVCTGEHDGGSWLSVADTGPGMPEHVRSMVFEPFFTTKGEAGTGLGLATVYATMQRHRGTVSLETALGAGSRFTLWFPVERPSASASTSVQPSAG